jgi:capsular exopolysaccharide synthesis family protein
MLDRQAKTLPFPSAVPTDVEIGLPQLLAFLRRQRWVIALSTLAFFCLGVAYLELTPKTYTATATLLIDPRKVAIFSSGNVLEDASITNSGVETQVQVIESGRIARAVADKLKLADDPAFMAPAPKSPVAMVRGWISAAKKAVLGSGPPSANAAANPVDPAAVAAAIVASHLNASRVGLSYAISISYQSTDGDQAARLANAVTQAYVDDQVQAQIDAAQRASEWLQSRLSDLQAKAQDSSLSAQEKSALRATYDNFLDRYTQTVQQQSLPFADAQVLTPAAPPASPTSPRSLVVVLGSILVGGAFGFGIALTRELLDKTVKTPSQVEAASEGSFLGFLPTFDMNPRTMRRLERKAKRLSDPETLRFSTGPAYSIVLTAPFSRYTETMRGVKVAAETFGKGRAAVLGIISAVPQEGRSTVAVNLARLIAEEGGRPLLIDGDIRNPTLSRNLVPAQSKGLAQVVVGAARISEVIWTDQATDLQFLPAGTDAGPGRSNAMLTAPATKAVINACRQQYDMVIVDLPAMVPLVDVRAAAPLFDAFLMVTAWGRTTDDVLRWAVHATGIEDRIIGTVLNRVNMRRMQGFEKTPHSAVPTGNYLHRYRHIA